MSGLDARSRRWAGRLEEVVAAHDTPGAALGVSWRGERVVLTAGTASLRSGLPVTPGTVFQLGSISKVYTATLLASLAGPGVGLLERPLADVLPEAAWVGREVRVRHLLTHTSGLGGDYFADTGRGDGCLRRYVAELAALPRDLPGPPGTRTSYCNSGYAVLGRLIEVMTGTTFDAALREGLLDPLGTPATSTLPEDSILHPAAVGHNRVAPGAGLTADAVWNFPRSCGPLGGVCAPVDDVLTLAELHLADGRTAGGGRLLPVAVAQDMRRRHAELPVWSRPAARGLGWGIYNWPGAELVGHDGETTGQIAKLRLLPEESLALVVLTNGIPDGGIVARAMEAEVLADWRLAPPTLPPPRDEPAFDPSPFAGCYRNLEGVVEVRGVPGGLEAVLAQEAAGLSESRRATVLRPIAAAAFVEVGGAAPATSAVHFADPDAGGRYRSYFDGRVAWRTGRA